MSSSRKQVSGWLGQTSFDEIYTWDIQKCLDFLALSETAQKKLPRGPKASLSRERVRQRLLEQTSDDKRIPATMEDCITTGVNAINQLTFLLNYFLPARLDLVLHEEGRDEMEQTLRQYSNRLEEAIKQLNNGHHQ